MSLLLFPRLLSTSNRRAKSKVARSRSAATLDKESFHRLRFERLEDRVLPSTLTADKLIYAPTETAMLQLSGFAPNETIDLQVIRTDGDTGLKSSSPGWLANDDLNGQLTVHYTMPADATLDSFVITATGTSSGDTASTTIWADSSHLLDVENDGSAPPATTIVLSSSALRSAPGQSVTFTATVNSTNTVNSGAVQFLVDGFNLGDPVAVVNGVATSTPITTLTPGQHTVTAAYSDASHRFDNSSISMLQASEGTTNSGAATSLVLSAIINKELDDHPAATFTASLSSSTVVNTGTVQFFVDGQAFGAPVSVIDGTATSDEVTDLDPGGHTISANYSDDTGAFQSSGNLLVYTVAWVDVRPHELSPGQFGNIVAGGFQVGETVDFQIKNLTNGHTYAPF